MRAMLFLCLCATACAAPTPPTIPVVKRKPALHTPSHQPSKDQPMRVASVLYEPQLLPMEGSVVKVTNDFGRYEFTASALQPANNSILFEVSPNPAGDWQPLAFFGPEPTDQKSFASLYSYSEALNVRAHITPVVSTMRQTGWMPASLVPASGGGYYINPAFKGARAWRVKR